MFTAVQLKDALQQTCILDEWKRTPVAAEVGSPRGVMSLALLNQHSAVTRGSAPQEVGGYEASVAIETNELSPEPATPPGAVPGKDWFDNLSPELRYGIAMAFLVAPILLLIGGFTVLFALT